MIRPEIPYKVIHLWWVNERFNISKYNFHEAFQMPKKMSEINVEKSSSILLHHIIACVSISNTKNIGCCTLSSGAFDKILVILFPIYCHFLSFLLIAPFLFNILQNRIFLIWPSPVTPLTILLVNPRQLLRVIDKFNVPDHVTSLNYIISDHLHVQPVLHPQSIHQLEHL